MKQTLVMGECGVGGAEGKKTDRLHRLWSDLQSATIEIMYQLNEGVGRRSL